MSKQAQLPAAKRTRLRRCQVKRPRADEVRDSLRECRCGLLTIKSANAFANVILNLGSITFGNRHAAIETLGTNK